MTILQALVLGVVQGIAEFLPISSSGHLTIIQGLFNIKEPVFFFDVMLHVGTLIPVLIVFRDEIWALLKKPNQKMTYLLIVGTIPAVIITLLLGHKADAFFRSGKYLSVCFILTGFFLLYADRKSDGTKRQPTYMDAIIIGCMQGVGILPGVSRSGSTITGALGCGINREAAAKFSFLLAIPAIGGALVLQLKDLFTHKAVMGNIGITPLVVGTLAAMISGYFAINFLLAIIKQAKLRYFAYYVFGVAIFVLVCQLVFHVQFTTSLS